MATYEEFIELPPFKDDEYHPPTELGNFDITFFPKDGILDVIVRADLEFVDSMNHKWESGEKTEFTKGLAEVGKQWNGKFTIECKKKGFEKVIAKPTFYLEATSKEPHFKVKIFPTKGTGNTAVRDDGTAKFGMQAVDRLANAKSQLAQIKRDLLSPFVIAIGSKGAQFSFATMFALESFAWTAHQAFEKNEGKVTLTLKGFGAENEKANKANADKVTKILQQFGYGGKFVLAAGAPDAPDDEIPLGVQLKFTESEFNANFPKDPEDALYFSQATIAHEFGHMLGLPDEYNALCSETANSMLGLGLLGAGGKMSSEIAARMKDMGPTGTSAAKSDKITKNQKVFTQLCSDAGIPVPPFGKATPSLMSGGSKFQACHGVTVWKALCDITKEHFTEDDWLIKCKG